MIYKRLKLNWQFLKIKRANRIIKIKRILGYE
jgi:hypothetical protein